MARLTSVLVYRKIQAEGLLSSLRWEVYDALYHHGPLTQMETCKLIRSKRQDRSYMPRFAELNRMGAIQEVGTRKCSVTGREVLIWDVTTNLPVKMSKRLKNINIRKENEACARIAEELKYLSLAAKIRERMV